MLEEVRELYSESKPDWRQGGDMDYYFKGNLRIYMDFSGGSESKECACKAGDTGSILVSGRFPWRKKWQPTPVFLPGESHGQRSLVGYSPWGRKKLDTTEATEHSTLPSAETVSGVLRMHIKLQN